MKSSATVLIAMTVLIVSSGSAAFADDADPLKPQTPSIDETKPMPPATPPRATLYGSAQRSESLLNGGAITGVNTGALNANVDAPKLQAENAAAQAFEAAAQKISQGIKLTSEEYRALEIGVTGIEAQVGMFSRYATIISVYRGSPAEQAGIRPGDEEIVSAAADKARHDPFHAPLFLNFDRAGTPMDVTIKRHGKLIPLTLIRMNIEDLADTHARRHLEDMIRRVGYKTGNYVGTYHHLKPQN
jgi:hypothetical protein